ncbi:MAG: sugar phosphate isomerase/epimerase family protein [Nitrososphaerota archaeon]|nr:sugar phosphate isomerase/epimerase [Candidatus Bathyarchaeota archaeon]MDW8022809.1 sugar phosphate isomerase/epimerase family protein [Nitrososphaerota archaeon]
MAKPEIGISMLYKLGLDFNESLNDVVKQEAKFIEVVDDGLHTLDKRRISKLIDVGSSYGLKYSIHAPFNDINIASLSKPLLKVMVKKLQKSIVNAGALEAQMWVLHPGMETGISMFYPGHAWNQNVKTIQQLHRFAWDYGVKIAVENIPEPSPFLMKSVEHFQKFYEAADGEIGLALDIGHANISGQTELFIEKFRGKIVHIHAHDNRGKFDEHLGIGRGTVNWDKIAKMLKEISYNKTIIVESIEHVPESLHKLKTLFF